MKYLQFHKSKPINADVVLETHSHKKRDGTETFSALLELSEVSPPFRVDSPHKAPVMLGFDIPFGVTLNNLLDQQSSCGDVRYMKLIWRHLISIVTTIVIWTY